MAGEGWEGAGPWGDRKGRGRGVTGRGRLTTAPQAAPPLRGPEVADTGAHERYHDHGDYRRDDACNGVSCWEGGTNAGSGRGHATLDMDT